jgi:DNA-directed RNA polymerase specialized sigma24 family protein
MQTGLQITQESFDSLLGWLAPDREDAGRRYEEIRKGLIRFFRFRGCDDPETLTDETINRVAGKLSSFTFDRNVKTITFFYSFASNIYLEDLAKRKKRPLQLDSVEGCPHHLSAGDDTQNDQEFDCLDECLSARAKAERDLMIQYYAREKSEKFELRKRLATEMNLSPAALHTKVHRLRAALRECLNDCLRRKVV